MIFLFIPIIIGLLYWKTKDYFYLIDDFVEREGYYNIGIMSAPPQIYLMKPSWKLRLWLVVQHCINCFIVYLLWGFYPALLLAIHPMSVWVTAWKTGGYYGTATFFTLITYFMLHNYPNVFGALVALPIFNAAINSTVCPLTFPFLAIFEPWIACLFIMLFWFLRSERWKTAMKVRNVLYLNPVRFDWKRPILMTKVVARYTFEAVFPIDTSFFSQFGDPCRDNKEQYDLMHRANAHFWASFILCLVVLIMGIIVDKFAITWFFILIGLHSQFGLTGQFYAQRYLYLAMIGIIIIIAKIGTMFPWLFFVYILCLLYKTIKFIPNFKNMTAIFKNDIVCNPKWGISYANLAAHLSKFVGNDSEIEQLLIKAEEMNPDTWVTQFNLGKMYIRKKEPKKALLHIENAIKCGADERSMIIFKELRKELKEVIDGKRQMS